MNDRSLSTLDLPKPPFGKTEMPIARFGFVAWAIGGDPAVGWGDQDEIANTIGASRLSPSRPRRQPPRFLSALSSPALRGSATA
jgi:hypothetical protein